MTESRAIDVIVPAHNAVRWLPTTLRWLTEPSVAHLRPMVIDDGSRDGTAAAARAFGDRVEVYRQRNLGTAAARNAGFERGTAPFVCFLDADDLLLPGALEPLREVLLRRPELVAAHGWTLAFRRNDPAAVYVEGWRQRGPVSLSAMSVLCGVHLGATLFRRESIERLGGFRTDEGLRGCSDWDLLVRAALTGGRIETVPRLACLYRQHRASMSASARGVARRETGWARTALRSFRERDVGELAPWSHLDVGVKAVALRWLRLGERLRFRELVEAAAQRIPEEALEGDLERAFASADEPDAATLFVRLAGRLLELGSPASAAAMFVRAEQPAALIAAAERSSAFAELLSTVRGALLRWAAAERAQIEPCWLATPVGRVPGHASPLAEVESALGSLSLAEGAVALAAEHFEAACALDPRGAWPRFGLARCAVGQGRPLEAGLALMLALWNEPRRAFRHSIGRARQSSLAGRWLRRVRE